MKKLFILLACLVCFSSTGICSTTSTDRETKISVFVTRGGRPLPRPRSVTAEAIEASIDAEAALLYITFNESFGKVNITVKNSMGIAVSAYNCDSTTEPMVVMSVPVTEDSYSLSITGSAVEAYGYYTIE